MLVTRATEGPDLSDLAVRIQGVGKRYRKGDAIFHRESFKEALLRIAGRWAPATRTRSPMIEDSHFWALEDISIDIKKGQILGLIGANGSGKSTLLKILARITKPTTGRIEISGKVGSLLEVGTGFHPELTGRENVYLNGVILGMRRREIDEKFDTIVEFSGIQDFLDTPVKRYSSGMQVRLAFSVAAHLEPEVLLLDEVLAVGDASFQKKSQSKMESVSRDGRTVILVSHSMHSVKSLCDFTVLLDHGQMVFAGPTNDAVAMYLELQGNGGTAADDTQECLQELKILEIKTLVGDRYSSNLAPDAPLTAEMELQADIHFPNVSLHLMIEDASGRLIVHRPTDLTGVSPVFDPGRYRVRATIPKIDLTPGMYYLWTRVYVSVNGAIQWTDSVKLPLTIVGSSSTYGLLEIPCEWTWQKK